MALDDFIVDSDCPMDMVVFTDEGTVSSFSSGFGSVSVPHGLPFTPLPVGAWSTDGGMTWQPMTGMNASPNQPFADVQADSNNVTVIVQLNSTNLPVQYRVFGFAPDGAAGNVTPPTLRFSNFALNTDFNYSKLVASTIWSLTATSSTAIITHGLGYIPEVIAWRESSLGVITPLINTNFGNAGEVALYATETAVVAECPSGAGGGSSISKIHVRVYGGKNG